MNTTRTLPPRVGTAADRLPCGSVAPLRARGKNASEVWNALNRPIDPVLDQREGPCICERGYKQPYQWFPAALALGVRGELSDACRGGSVAPRTARRASEKPASRISHALFATEFSLPAQGLRVVSSPVCQRCAVRGLKSTASEVR